MGQAAGVVIVGAGQAACMAAVSLRQYGYRAPIALIGDESHLPYQRPPLSKAMLLGKISPAELRLRPAEFFTQHSIELLLGDPVVAVHRHRCEVQTAGGQVRAYEHLILATGALASRPPFPGATHSRVRVLRDLDQALDLQRSWQTAQHVCVIGGGFIGLELAASARAMGLNVTVLEGADRVLARVASEELSTRIADLHRRNGVVIKLGQQVQAVHFLAESQCQVHLASGGVVRADQILLATGASPRDEIARAAGLQCDRGVCVDVLGRTEDPKIWAMGDCTKGPEQPGRAARQESIPSANEQARRIAAQLAGQPIPDMEVPWLWSEHYGLKLQLAGHRGPDAQAVVRTYPGADRLSIFHVGLDGCLQAVESLDDSGSFMAARTWLRKPTPLHLDRLADPMISLPHVPVS
jgi:3-phenylpropionate/trans-cinnamate dioxygenase ferredoxin reductase subunit